MRSICRGDTGSSSPGTPPWPNKSGRIRQEEDGGRRRAGGDRCGAGLRTCGVARFSDSAPPHPFAPRGAKTALADLSAEIDANDRISRHCGRWNEAIADSGLDVAQLRRFGAVRAVVEGAGAQWWAPEVSVHEPPVQLELREDDAAAADRPPLLEKHRVATAPIENLEPPLADAAFAAKLRHELEHARQWEICGPEPFMLMQLAREVHRRKTGGMVYGAFLNQMPIEDDANAAASLFVRKRWPDCVDELRRHEAYGTLARAVLGPATPETLVVRMVGFLFHYRDIVRDLAGGGAISESRYVGLYARSGVRAWQALCDAADAAK
jgi:hypothetical protein